MSAGDIVVFVIHSINNSDPSISCNSWNSAHMEIKHIFTLFQMIRQVGYQCFLCCLLLMSPFFGKDVNCSKLLNGYKQKFCDYL